MTPVISSRLPALRIGISVGVAAVLILFPFGIDFSEVVRGAPAEWEESGTFPKSGVSQVVATGRGFVEGTADDPAIWVHPTNPALSVVIGTNKRTEGGLHVFDLNGVQLQFVSGGKHNNVDLRYSSTARPSI